MTSLKRPPSVLPAARAEAGVRATGTTVRPTHRTTFIAGRYSLETVIGKGGMGEVWSAYDRKLGRRVALKLVDFGTGELDDGRARFTREVGISNQLKGPAFAEVFAHGTHGDRAFLVMELLEGETLQARLAKKGTLTVDETRELLTGMAGGLRLAHALRIVHRDLKPSNIFLAKVKPNASGARPLDGRKEIVKLLDFGIAKETWDDARLTQPGVMMGSAHYMSPEQISSGRDVDTRADLWGVAALLFRSLTGLKPFDGAPSEALSKILSDKAPLLSRTKPGLPAGLDWFFDTAFKKDPAKRFQTIDDMVEGFAQACVAIASERVSDPLEVDVTWVPPFREDSRPTVVELRPPVEPPCSEQNANVQTGTREDVESPPFALARFPVKSLVSQPDRRATAAAPLTQAAPIAVAPRTVGKRPSRWLGAVVVVLVALITLAVARVFHLFAR